MPTSIQRSLAALSAVLATGTCPMLARASGVDLYLNAPYDFATNSFDLDELDTQNQLPYFEHSFSIPYSQIESEGNAILQPLASAGRHGDVACDALGIDGLCPDAHWEVYGEASFAFTQRNAPALTSYGAAANNGVHIKLDSQVQVGVNAHVHVTLPDSPIPDPEVVDIPANALIGIHASADVTLYPTVSLQNVKIDFTNDSLDVEIHGLDGQAIGLGAGLGLAANWLGGVALNPLVAAGLGAVVGEGALEIAREQAKHAIEELIAEQLAQASPLISKAVSNAMQPHIRDANDVLRTIQDVAIPGVNMSLGQLQNQFGMSIDVRSQTSNSTIRTAVTSRFANVPASKTVSGTMRFPRKRCQVTHGGDKNSPEGELWFSLGLSEVNQDLAAMSCADLLASEFAHSVYYGANPDQVLQSGDPRNALLSWGGLGALQSDGPVIVEDDAYACAFTISGLPDNAILELGAANGSTLQTRLDVTDSADLINTYTRPRASRFLTAQVGGASITVNHDGELVSDQALELGRRDPVLDKDCPAKHSGGGEQAPAGTEQPGKDCPQCGSGIKAWDPSIYVTKAPEISRVRVPQLQY